MIRQQRDLYKFAHDQTIRLMNHGLTATEIVPPVVVLLPPPQPAMIDMNASTNERERHFDKSLSMMVLSAV